MLQPFARAARGEGTRGRHIADLPVTRERADEAGGCDAKHDECDQQLDERERAAIAVCIHAAQRGALRGRKYHRRAARVGKSARRGLIP